MENSKDYVEVMYDEKDKPYTDYPQKLTKYLFKTFKLKEKDKLLELGCGRGEFLKEFIDLGVDAYAIDQSDFAKKRYPSINVKKINILENKKLPYPDNFFDVIYSKSFIEHFYYPEEIFKEIFRLLKTGGKVITLTPNWRYGTKDFYDHFTHRTPFTKQSLMGIHKIYNFENVRVKNFIQLPLLWSKNNILRFIFTFLSFLTRCIFPEKFKSISKWIKFSKEIMLISYAEKK